MEKSSCLLISNCHRFNQSELKKTVKRFNRLLKRLSSVAGKASLSVDTVMTGELFKKNLLVIMEIF